MSTSRLAVIVAKYDNLSVPETSGKSSAESILDSTADENSRLLPTPISASETTSSYIARCGNIAVVKDYSVVHTMDQLISLADRTTALEKETAAQKKQTEEWKKVFAENKKDIADLRKEFAEHSDNAAEVLRKNRELLRKGEIKTIALGLGNLQVAALRRLRKRAGYPEPTENIQMASSAVLVNWMNKMKPNQLPSFTDHVLHSTDHDTLSKMKYVEDRNDAAHESWGELATLLTKQRFSPIREQWSRIFHFVTGKTIDEEATDPSEDTSPYAEIVKLIGGLHLDEED